MPKRKRKHPRKGIRERTRKQNNVGEGNTFVTETDKSIDDDDKETETGTGSGWTVKEKEIIAERREPKV